MSSQAGIHVSRSVSPEREPEPTTPVIFGPISGEPLAFFDPDGRCLRTSQGTLALGLEMSSPTLPRSGMQSNGIVFPLVPAAPLTDATGCSPWPTPTARLGTARGPQAARYTDPRRSNDLDDAVAWAQERKMWPTPDASPHKYRLQGNSQQSKRLNGLAGGQLNPAWVERLMGFPAGWTLTD